MHEGAAELPRPLPLQTPRHELARNFNADDIRVGEIYCEQNHQRPVGTTLIHDFTGDNRFLDVAVLQLKKRGVSHLQSVGRVIALLRETARFGQKRVAPNSFDSRRNIWIIPPKLD